jgi:xylan 1,4-beta-xylosidase
MKNENTNLQREGNANEAMIFFCGALVVSLAMGVACANVNVQLNVQSSSGSRRLNGDLIRGGIGSCHATTSLRSDWQAQLHMAHQSIGTRRVRFHGVFDDDMSVVLPDGSFSFLNAFKSFDAILQRNVVPLVELSFMPEAYASLPGTTIFHYKGNISPPANVTQWTTLVQAFASALIDRYTLPVVSTWIFEVFNEPNCGFWSGSQIQYYQFYASTAIALKAVSGSLRVAGPVTCQLAWIDDFCRWCLLNRVPLDVVTSHLYPSDPQLPIDRLAFAQAVNNATATAAKYGKPFFLTEYNAGLDFNAAHEILDTSYAAAFVAAQLGHLSGDQMGISYWSLSDIFEEQGQYAGEFGTSNPTPFGILTVSGVPKPVFRAFELLNHFAGASIWNAQVKTPRGTVASVDAWATIGANNSATVFLSNFWPLAMQQMSGTITPSNVSVSIVLPSPPVGVLANVFRIDESNANPRAEWSALGAPVYPTAFQLTKIAAASVVVPTVVPITFSGTTVSFDIPAFAIDSFAAVQIQM